MKTIKKAFEVYDKQSLSVLGFRIKLYYTLAGSKTENPVPKDVNRRVHRPTGHP
jgi:hypothetical protein